MTAPSNVRELALRGDNYALRFRELLDPSDVVVVFERTGGGVADICLATREDTADMADDDALRSELHAAPVGVLIVILTEDGSTWIERSAMGLINCGWAQRWAA